MKILLNVSRELVGVGEWHRCVAIKLEEQEDGSFDLIVTNEPETKAGKS